MIGWAVLVVGVASHLQSVVLQQSEELFVNQMDVWSKQLHHLTGGGGVNPDQSYKQQADVQSCAFILKVFKCTVREL